MYECAAIAMCDPGSDCIHGDCIDGVCMCAEGWGGIWCERRVLDSESSTVSPSLSPTPSVVHASHIFHANSSHHLNSSAHNTTNTHTHLLNHAKEKDSASLTIDATTATSSSRPSQHLVAVFPIMMLIFALLF
jgi:hypothetical protein